MNSNPGIIINHIKLARLNANRSMKTCADFLRISLDRYVAYEAGTQIPSLPEIELLAFFLKTPISKLLENEIEPNLSNLENSIQNNFGELINLRNKIIGAKIRILRDEKKISASEFASKAGFCEDDLVAYELGITPIRLSILRRILDNLDCTFSDLIDKESFPDEGQMRINDFASPSLRPNNHNLEFLDGLSIDELKRIQLYIADLINYQETTFNRINTD